MLLGVHPVQKIEGRHFSRLTLVFNSKMPELHSMNSNWKYCCISRCLIMSVTVKRLAQQGTPVANMDYLEAIGLHVVYSQGCPGLQLTFSGRCFRSLLSNNPETLPFAIS